ncbi:tetratricopeptide repeat protein [Microbaculum marinum]|uniref:tetratricopeptide repeat protein n=1 Tax=Microbaculum marinum TaxID=1764581 RepID=UPI00366FA0C5
MAGDSFLDQYHPEMLRDGLYFPDGQIDDEVFVYGSFLQSRMHQRGVTCSDCHDPHSGELHADGNDVCTACHNETPPEKFATIKPLAYDSPTHHFHEAGKPGSFCVDCHMPSRTYMTVDPRRDHSFRVPRPDLFRRTGSPDACTGCHTDRDAAWAASAIVDWYGEERHREPHYGEALALGRKGAPGAAAALSGLAADAGEPAIVRATAVEMLGDFLDSRTVGPVALAGQDEDPLLRLAAVAAAGALPPDARVDIAGPLLDDPVRAVRIAAARALAAVPEETFLGARREAYLGAVDEYLASQLAVAERPETHLNLGIYWSERGDADKAEAAYLQSLALDPDYTPGMINLAELYRATGRIAEEAEILQRALDTGEADAAILHAAGLLRVRQKRYDEALELLRRAHEAQPGESRFGYVYAVALDSLGRPQAARKVRADALARNPYDVDLLTATLHQSLLDDDIHAARQLADRLSALRPDDAELQRLRERLRR